MIAVKLLDGTTVYGRDFTVGHHAIFLEQLRYSGKDECPIYVDEAMTISLDAVDVYFIIHEGQKEEDLYVEEVSEDTNDPPTPA